MQGRPNPAPQSTIGDHLNLNIALSVPVESTDLFELIDFNTGTEEFSQSWNSSRNTFSQLFYWPSAALIQASMGDKAYLTHVKSTSHFGGAGQTWYISWTQAEMTPALSIEMASGVVSDVNSVMTQGASGVFRANFELSAFGALNSQIATGTNQNLDRGWWPAWQQHLHLPSMAVFPISQTSTLNWGRWPRLT